MSLWHDKPLIIAILLVVILGAILITFSQPLGIPEPNADSAVPYISYYLPTKEGTWVPNTSHTGDLPTGTGTVIIEDIGEFTFDVSDVKETVRPDVFQPGHFSVFDALVQLDRQGNIKLDYHFDETMDTHVIDAINGEKAHWWYEAKYSAGWYEQNAFRMDMYPYKNGTETQVLQSFEVRLARVYQTFREEVARLTQNSGQVVIPKVTIGHKIFTDVRVTAHNLRTDVLQPGVVTALDVVLSLAEQGKIQSLKLTWYERIGKADPVDSYWVEQIDFGDGLNDSEASGNCGWVYETGPQRFTWFSGNHIHIPSEVRVTVSPEYATWFWICV